MTDDARRLWLMILAAAWLLTWGGSFLAFWQPPIGDGLTRGLNRAMTFLGWQGIAGMLAVAIFGITRRWPARSPVRRLGLLPLACAVVLVAVLLGLVAWGRFGG